MPVKVSMVEINRQASQIVNRVVESGEPAVIIKHGKPIAEIRPVIEDRQRALAMDFLFALKPVPVQQSPEQILNESRARGF